MRARPSRPSRRAQSDKGRVVAQFRRRMRETAPAHVDLEQILDQIDAALVADEIGDARDLLHEVSDALEAHGRLPRSVAQALAVIDRQIVRDEIGDARDLLRELPDVIARSGAAMHHNPRPPKPRFDVAAEIAECKKNLQALEELLGNRLEPLERHGLHFEYKRLDRILKHLRNP